MTLKTDKRWRVWDKDNQYGDLLYRRATGESPEMDSSKAVARILKDYVSQGERLLDVGCGAGHYYRSLKNLIDVEFTYHGVDATVYYVESAKKAWKDDSNASFSTADIFSLPFADNQFDIVMCCNVLLHLPSIKIPLRELARVGKKCIVIRFLVGDRSFRIQEVYSPKTHSRWFEGEYDVDEFDDEGRPRHFHYFNIYSRTYVENQIKMNPDVKRIKFIEDTFFNPENISAEVNEKSPIDITKMAGKWQVNGYILQPWNFVILEK